MPTYDYVKKNGEVVSLFMSMKEMKKREDESGCIVLEDGSKAQRSWGGFQSSCPSNYPMKSDAMGVNPVQIPEAMAADNRLGIRIHYDPNTGQATYADKIQRKKHCEAHGFFDRNGGYSDPQRS